MVGHVKSQTAHLPRSQGTTVAPSGLLPSVRERPGGSRRAGIAADVKAQWIIELTAECRKCLPSLFLHDRGWMANLSTEAPQW